MPTRKRRQSGGNSNTYSFGAAVAPGAPYASEVVQGSGCMAATRPGEIAGYSPSGLGGLPGMAGGSRRRRRYRHRGGRYSVAPAPYPADSSTGPNVFTPVAKLGCAFQGGGGGLGAGVAAYSAPTAGYSNGILSGAVDSVGAPIQIQTPYDARTMNQACLKTGGGKRRSKRRSSKRRSSKRKH